eukprot:TRINITY_DN3438_c0_g1_i2.p3 TRINITY_DN3438_c0_g1~~TRINITY_DN3438_c0_g1_i2.p3  ORF type:complete len:118 (-),score=30.51 TRINITY_DN3438_c0_g1_i2:486-839(-)
MIRRPPRSTLSSSSAASDVYKRQGINAEYGGSSSRDMAKTFAQGRMPKKKRSAEEVQERAAAKNAKKQRAVARKQGLAAEDTQEVPVLPAVPSASDNEAEAAPASPSRTVTIEACKS